MEESLLTFLCDNWTFYYDLNKRRRYKQQRRWQQQYIKQKNSIDLEKSYLHSSGADHTDLAIKGVLKEKTIHESNAQI